jgi:hypothetical protein
MTERSLQEARDEVERELCVRKRCFARWVECGRLSRSDATDRLERMETALHQLNKLLDLQSVAVPGGEEPA